MNRILNIGLIALAMAVSVGSSSEALAQDSLVADQDMTPKQKIEFARSANQQISDALKGTEKTLEAAERSGDPDAIKCVQSKLASIRALDEVSARATGQMNEQLAANNGPRADHFLNQVAVSLSKVRQFSQEASQCVGEGSDLDGTTEIQVNADAIAEGDDTSPMMGDDALVGEVNPPQSSPFQ